MKKCHRYHSFFLLLALLSLSFASCTLASYVTIHHDNTATVTLHISWQKPLEKYWGDLQELDPSLPREPLDAVAVQSALEEVAAQPKSLLHNPKVISGTRTLQLTFQLDISSPQAHLWGIELNSTAQGHILTMNWNHKALLQWLGTTSYSHSDALASFLPDSKTTSQELQKNFAYAIGSYSAHPDTLISNSTIQLVIKLPNPVQQLQGDAAYKGNLVTCKWPLTDFLTRNQTVVIKY